VRSTPDTQEVEQEDGQGGGGDERNSSVSSSKLLGLSTAACDVERQERRDHARSADEKGEKNENLHGELRKRR